MQSSITQMVSHLGMVDRDFERHVTAIFQINGYPDMTRVRFAILRSLKMTGKPNQKAISELTGITPQAIHRHMKFLEEKGYVERQKKKSDGRSQDLYITQKGEETLGGAFAIAKEAMKEYFKNLSEAEMKTITQLLQKIKRVPKDLESLT